MFFAIVAGLLASGITAVLLLRSHSYRRRRERLSSNLLNGLLVALMFFCVSLFVDYLIRMLGG